MTNINIEETDGAVKSGCLGQRISQYFKESCYRINALLTFEKSNTANSVIYGEETLIIGTVVV